MQDYRAYVIDRENRIVRGEWLRAADDAEARQAAQDLCDPDHPSVEVWQGARYIDRLPCGMSYEEATGRRD
jgi:hypothetical protein